MTTSKKKTAKKETPKRLVEKMYDIMCDLDFIEKDAKNTHSHYNYASEKAIKIAVHDAFVKHRVICIPCFGDARTIELQPSKNGDVQKSSVLDATFKFINVDDEEDILMATCIGSGNGRDDKGLYAAVTGAIKYALTGCFLIPTGDDAEADGNRPTARAETPQNEPEQPETEPEDDEPSEPVEPAQEQPPASKPAVKKKVAKKPVAKKKVAKKPDPKFIWGEPEGDPICDEDDKLRILKAFSEYDINEGELEAVSGLPILEWTANIKKVALQNYNCLEDGTFTKEDVVQL